MPAEFDYVIVDSSPQLAVTDGALLAANADGALIIARHGQTKRDQLAHGIANLKDVGAIILGAVSTMEPVGRGGSYRYRYGYYGYGSDEDTTTNEVSQSSGDSASGPDQVGRPNDTRS